MNWDYLLLVMEMVLACAIAALGIVLIVRGWNNRLRMVWGVMVLLVGLLILNDDIFWLRQPDLGVGTGLRIRLLVLWRILKWFVFAHIFSLFPLASMRPGWLTPLRLIVFSVPLWSVMLIGGCYLCFNGYCTPLHSLSDIAENIDQLNVRVRIGMFIASVVFPFIYLIIPFLGKWITSRRRLSLGMYLYFGTSMILALYYIAYSLFATNLIFQLYGCVTAILPIAFSVLFLRDENPLSIPTPVREPELRQGPQKIERLDDPGLDRQDEVSPMVYKLYLKMSQWMEAETPFTSPDYTIRNLIEELNTNNSLLIKAIHYGGFTGFREYVNYLRLEHFKRIAVTIPGASIKELMFRCGFTSRSSFYRQFAEQEHISPKEYLDRLYREAQE